MRTVVTLGEMLIDFLPMETGEGAGEPGYLQKAGGAPANVAACVVTLGGKAAFVGKRGNDAFGHFLKHVLEECGVDTQFFTATDEAKTGLAFVSLDASGDRSFLFYRDPSADMLLQQSEIPLAAIAEAGILHVGSISLIAEPSRSATLFAVEEAKRQGVFISYDPNWRPALWPSESYALESIRLIYPHCDLIKINREELLLLTGSADAEAGAAFFHREGIAHVLVTLDADGCYYSFMDAATAAPLSGYAPGIAVDCKDTTGAGDAFVGAFLYQLSRHDTRKPSASAMQSWVRFSVLTSALVTTKKGAIAAMPTAQEVELFNQSVK